GRPEHFLEADVGARLTAVVVGVDEVDAEALEPPEGLDRALVVRGAGADLGVVERDGRELDAGAVQVEVAAVNPELAEPEPDGEVSVEDFVLRSEERDVCFEGVPRGVDVPEVPGLPPMSYADTTADCLLGLERLAPKFEDGAAALADLDA